MQYCAPPLLLRQPRSYDICPVSISGKNPTVRLTQDVNSYFKGAISYESICELLLAAGANQNAIAMLITPDETEEKITDSDEIAKLNIEADELNKKSFAKTAKEAAIAAIEKSISNELKELKTKLKTNFLTLDQFNTALIELGNRMRVELEEVEKQ